MSRLLCILLIGFCAMFTLQASATDRTIRIVGGTEVSDLRYPWMASIYFRFEGSRFFPGCGGSLISPRWILSAAHCFVDAETGLQSSADDVAVLLGAVNLASDDGIFEVVSRIVVHPNYDVVSSANDIALLELPEAVAFEPITIPSLANPVPLDGELATVAGWGATTEGGSQSAQLLEVDVPIVAHNACLPFYEDSLNQPLMVCAGGTPLGGRDSCQGDSGGPLFVSRGNQPVQAGVVSFGVGCARPGIPAVYTRLTGYANWISGIVSNPSFYDGSNADDVVAVSDPVEVLAPNSRIRASVVQGDTDLYQSSGINQILLETFAGDADLYVFNSAVFSRDSLVCLSEEETAIDQCSFDREGSFYIAVSGFASSEYALTVSSGSGEVVEQGVVTLQLDVAVGGSLLEGTAAVYRATNGNLATLTSVSGDADLLVFSSDDFSVDTLICSSEEAGSAIDSCAYADADSEVFVGVFGYTDTDYSLVISANDVTVNPNPVVSPQAGVDEGRSGGGGVSGLIVLLALSLGVRFRRRIRGC